jgi:hypothetical protein
LGLAEVFVAGAGGLSEIRLIAFGGFFSNRVLTSVSPKDSAALGTLSESLRTLGLTNISGLWASDYTGENRDEFLWISLGIILPTNNPQADERNKR